MIPHPIRFGVWALVGGVQGSRYHPDEKVDPSWERNRAQVLLAEELGYDTTLVAQHTLTPGDGDGPLEAWTGAAALAALTSKIEVIAAIKPFLYHPAVLSKMALQIEEISGGRFAINVVSAFLKPELMQAGLPFLQHDERYEYSKEWLRTVSRMMSSERVTHHGKYFNLDDYRVAPRDRHRQRPRIYSGGESVPGRILAAELADVWFLNGQTIEEASALIADVSSRPRPERLAPLRYGMAAFVITRETHEEAEAARAFAEELDVKDQIDYDKFLTNIDRDVVMFQRFREQRHIGTNGGTRAGLVGTYDEVAQRIVDFADIGIDTWMLQFQPTELEMARFAHEVIPRVRRLEARLAA